MLNKEKIEVLLRRFDKVFFLVNDFGELSMLSSLTENEAMDKGKYFFLDGTGLLGEHENLVQRLSAEEVLQLGELYYTYEFADNFIVIDEVHPAYAGIFNYVRAGIMKPEEAWMALIR